MLQKEKIVSATEFEVKGMAEERTEWQGQNESQRAGEEKRNGRLVGGAETSGEYAEWHRLQRKNLSKLGLPKRRKWPQCYKESGWEVRQSFLYQKEQYHQSKSPDREEEESQSKRELHLD